MNERLYCAHHKSLNDPFEGLFSTIEWKSDPQFLNLMGDFSLGGSGPLNMLGDGMPVFMSEGEKYKKTVYNELPAAKINTRICSLSSSMADVRMWSLYASGHTGCVIEVDLEPDQKQIIEVQYDAGIRQFKDQMTKDAKAIDVLSFKTDHWEYEKEYRIFSEQEFYPVTGKITGVYLGIRVQNIYKDLVVRCTPPEIPVYETRIREATVEITPNGKIN